MTLSQRIQTASADETRALLEEAYEAVHGKSCDWFRYYGEIDQKHDARAFDNMLNAEAYLDAAMMLLPEGWMWSIGSDGPEEGPWACLTAIKDLCEDISCCAATPALALCAAALIAREASNGDL